MTATVLPLRKQEQPLQLKVYACGCGSIDFHLMEGGIVMCSKCSSRITNITVDQDEERRSRDSL